MAIAEKESGREYLGKVFWTEEISPARFIIDRKSTPVRHNQDGSVVQPVPPHTTGRDLPGIPTGKPESAVFETTSLTTTTITTKKGVLTHHVNLVYIILMAMMAY